MVECFNQSQGRREKIDEEKLRASFPKHFTNGRRLKRNMDAISAFYSAVLSTFHD